ncbi:MAG: class I SAM-dependent methyltransferase [Eubacteriales bacterium]|nr:class I SAM-dependent methyltransferase [Eubacteriales bacterium]
MQLSVRLAAVAQMAEGAECLADIGTDHGYIPIYLMEQGKLRRALAMDINKGPLLRAQENIQMHGLQESIETRLSDGAKMLRPGEADTVVIAGMGGALTMRILSDGAEALKGIKTFVLQPQSEIEKVRRFLHVNGFCIEAENMVKDEGKYYPLMRAVYGRQETWETYEYRFGKYLIEQKNPVLLEFLQKEEKKYRQILERLGENDSRDAVKRGKELQNSLFEIEKAISLLSNEGNS